MGKLSSCQYHKSYGEIATGFHKNYKKRSFERKNKQEKHSVD